jgi:hypothetical protein
MSGPTWWSQPVAAEGSSASEGIRRQLGKPRLDPLTVLVRETAQNSCDAAAGDGDVDFDFEIRRLSGDQLDNWSEYLLPEPDRSDLAIAAVLRDDPTVLMISDRGTTGLGGPIRSDEIPLLGERSDFVNFIRNVGERKGGELSGGSYGFGKGILYNLSRCHVIVADSVCTFRGSRQRRLIGAALGDSYQHEHRLYTGRHWLGEVDADGYPVPLLDEDASSVARRLGMPNFADGATGTTVAIVGIDLGHDGDARRDPERAAQFLVSTMLWNLWPRMLKGRESRLVCSVNRNGFRTQVPDPEELPLLAPFADAYREIVTDGDYESPLRKQRPRDVGRFALRHGMAPTWSDEMLSAAAPFEGRAHHCARMRHADLVVDYLPGDAPVNERLQYGAVFRASIDADAYFAEAEPPTHDQWVLTGLKGTARGVVQLANGFIRDRLKSAGAPPVEQSADSSAEPLGHFAAQFASVIATAEGESATASTPGTRPQRHGASRARGVRFVETPSLVMEDGYPVIKALVELPPEAKGKLAEIVPAVLTDDGAESVGAGGPQPVALGWTAEENGRTVDGSTLPVTAPVERRWFVRVRPAPDTVTRVSVRLDEAAQ